MTESASSIIAIVFGLAVFGVIVAVGWRSVQNRRILRLQDSNGQETIIVTREGDDISSVVTTTQTTRPAAAPASSVAVANRGVADQSPARKIGRSAAENETAVDGAGRGRLRRVVSSTK